MFSGGNGDDAPNAKIAWTVLENESQLETILRDSKTKTQVIFKHSTTCGISRMALNRFTANFSLAPNLATMYFLDLHAFRKVSNTVAAKFNVIHQSPQLIIIRNGAVVFHTSHGAIPEVNLETYV